MRQGVQFRPGRKTKVGVLTTNNTAQESALAELVVTELGNEHADTRLRRNYVKRGSNVAADIDRRCPSRQGNDNGWLQRRTRVPRGSKTRDYIVCRE